MNKNKFSIYNHPQLYDDIMWWKNDDIEFWKQIIKQKKCKSVLEICCGTGRIGQPLLKNNIDYYGIDNSELFIDFFASKLNNYDKKKLILSDASNFDLNKKFDLVFIGFNSLAHLLTNKDVESCFRCIKNHMHENSIFGIDIFMPSHELISNVNKNKVNLMELIDSSTQKKLNILESNSYNAATEVNHISWEFIDSNKEIEFIYNFDMRIFFPDTLNRLLTDSKFFIDKFYGNYELQSFNQYSEKQIYICSK